jgi:hypothetical protein
MKRKKKNVLVELAYLLTSLYQPLLNFTAIIASSFLSQLYTYIKSRWNIIFKVRYKNSQMPALREMSPFRALVPTEND